MKKGAIFLLIYGIILYIAFLYRDSLLEWVNHSDLSQLPLMFFLVIIFGIIPVIPFTVFAALMGAKYGTWIGSTINWIGTIGASAFFFILARYFFVHQFRKYIPRFKKIKQFDEIINQNAFIAVLFARMIPIVPPPVVNIYSGLTSMTFKIYILATAIGKIPGTIIYAYLGNHLFTSNRSILLGLFIYVVFIIIVLLLYRWWFKASSDLVVE
ncbi:putative membrane protein YdjX (TVP38/TMEM64 family) [Bacillus mesophilus]|uniref:TVP38/TMEM64 family membrane protein n=1 Tax=Bacillus mesophilus TaxID=1808955 RepID=A0A6M0Q8B4_9BACI|nr:TVP38/TMEM64 family protein [Bacillus mesophilus]MBM7662071.1 putative membrane protein YdjX (TVP38/TMEM64 family) [Bacillus mesophilus]NEY72574.1 TVP38/TMEM64 family protein [Bacillus mesophilus]